MKNMMTLSENVVSNENLLAEVKKVRSPEQISLLYNMVVLMRSNDPSVRTVSRRRNLDFTTLPKVDVTQSLQEIMDDLRGNR
ncbi:hypothetical protein AGMMS49982_05630 [Bacteroidia bacterium]|nr:hypothetical protein AGMMS49982_05630 [Bacteroidia bacterium]